MTSLDRLSNACALCWSDVTFTHWARGMGPKEMLILFQRGYRADLLNEGNAAGISNEFRIDAGVLVAAVARRRLHLFEELHEIAACTNRRHYNIKTTSLKHWHQLLEWWTADEQMKPIKK